MVGAKALSPSSSVLVAKAWGMREGINGALSLGIKNLCIEGDNLVVINSLKQTWKVPLEITNFVHDAGTDLSHFTEFSFNHCFREANQATSFMAYKGHSHHTLH